MEPSGSQYSQMGKTRLYFLPRLARMKAGIMDTMK